MDDKLWKAAKAVKQNEISTNEGESEVKHSKRLIQH